MIDESGSATPTGTTAVPTQDAGQQDAQNAQNVVVAFCQQCGRGLTASSQRRVGAGIFCEPCATVRTAPDANWSAVPTSTAGPYTAGPAATAATQEPNPVLAGFLGLIPGVGAMYNGQYAKGVVHLIVFVVLVSLADNLNWVLWWFVWGWVFYQAFEAYHTAQARRDGQPLPDPFGWNELGDRLGFSRHWPPPVGSASPARPSAPGTGFGTARPPYDVSAPRPYTPQNVSPAVSAPVPPPQSTTPGAAFPSAAMPAAAFASTPVPGTAVPPTAATGAAMPNATLHAGAFTQVPYQNTFVGTPSTAAGQPVFVLGAKRFPVGAAWLIGLGVLFLLGNLMPNWHVQSRWLVPLLLAAIGLWTGGTRLTSLREARTVSGSDAGVPAVAGALVLPGILLTLAALLVLQDAEVLPLRHSWPALLIVWGALIFLQRAVAPEPVFADPSSPTAVPASPAADAPAP